MNRIEPWMIRAFRADVALPKFAFTWRPAASKRRASNARLLTKAYTVIADVAAMLKANRVGRHASCPSLPTQRPVRRHPRASRGLRMELP